MANILTPAPVNADLKRSELETSAQPTATTQELKKMARRLRRVCDLIDDGQEIALKPDEIDQLTTGLSQVEKLLKNRKGPTKVKPRPKPIDPQTDHIAILKWINDRKFASTSQVRKYSPIQDATSRLRELEQAHFLTGYRYQLHKGTQSEKCYWLSAKGANLLTNKGTKARSETRYKQHPPDEHTVQFAEMNLELPFQARIAGWNVIKPQTFNSKNPKGDQQTEQTTAIANALHLREHRQINEAATRGQDTTKRQTAFNQYRHLAGIPTQLNNHVCYKPNHEAVMIFVLCQPQITGQFLEARMKEYSELVKRVKIWLVFYSKEYVEVWAEAINKAGFGIATLASLPDLFRDWNDAAIKNWSDNR